MKTKPAPTLEEILAKVDALPEEQDLSYYFPALVRLRNKGMSLRAIADFMTNELGRRVTHPMVYRLLRDATALPNEQPDYEDIVDQRLIDRAALKEEVEEGK